MNLFFDPTLEGLARVLTLRQQRHEVLASNLANVETPNYKAKELDFGDALQDAFETSEVNVLGEKSVARPSVVDDPNGPRRADGNTVDLDLQMTKLTANGGDYLKLARILGKRIGLLRTAIEGTR
jgi:flagellar basal-body rod protein FlgB